nr:MAG TPA: zipper dimerization domain transcription factor-like protein [Caudoviricetes sp.]
MDQKNINNALQASVQELSNRFSEEIISKNLLAVQLVEANQKNELLTQQNAELQARISELESLLDEQTKPAIKE